MTYPVVTLPRGQYRVEYRVTSLSSGGSLRLEYSGGSPVYGILSIPTTGGWQNWQTVSHTINLSTGSYWFAIFCHTGWLELKLVLYQLGDNFVHRDPTASLAQSQPILYKTLQCEGSAGRSLRCRH